MYLRSPLAFLTAKYGLRDTRWPYTYISPAVRGTAVRVMHIEDWSQEAGRKTRRVATSPTTETNLAQFLPFYTQLASCGCSSQWVTPDKKRNGPAGKLQFFWGNCRKMIVNVTLLRHFLLGISTLTFIPFFPRLLCDSIIFVFLEVYKLLYNINKRCICAVTLEIYSSKTYTLLFVFFCLVE